MDRRGVSLKRVGGFLSPVDHASIIVASYLPIASKLTFQGCLEETKICDL